MHAAQPLRERKMHPQNGPMHMKLAITAHEWGNMIE